MKANSASERAEAHRLAGRAERCALLCRKMGDLDRKASIIGREVDTCTQILQYILARVDRDALRLSACLRIMELVFDLQEEGIADRCAELGIAMPDIGGANA